MSTANERQIRDVRDVWGGNNKEDKENSKQGADNTTAGATDNRNKHKYKSLERHLSMKKTIRRKMMRDLREIGDASNEAACQSGGFLEQIRADEPPPANVDKPSLWRRLTKGWSHS